MLVGSFFEISPINHKCLMNDETFSFLKIRSVFGPSWCVPKLTLNLRRQPVKTR